jgi:hypothetical protein
LKYRSANRLRELGAHKSVLWVKIVFPGLIDHAQLPELLSAGIREGDIDLPPLERDLIP